MQDYNSTKLGDCFLHIIDTGDEYNLKDLSYEFVEFQQLSVRCQVQGTSPDRLVFLYGENESHTERSAPYFLRGEQVDGSVNFVPYLEESCGSKTLVIIALGYYGEYIFDEKIEFELQCQPDVNCIVPACTWMSVWDPRSSACVDNTEQFILGSESAFVCPSGSYKVYGRDTNTMADCECCAWKATKDVCANRCLSS